MKQLFITTMMILSIGTLLYSKTSDAKQLKMVPCTTEWLLSKCKRKMTQEQVFTLLNVCSQKKIFYSDKELDTMFNELVAVDTTKAEMPSLSPEELESVSKRHEPVIIFIDEIDYLGDLAKVMQNR